MKNATQEHFEVQNKHTELKHNLLQNTLNTAIGIANHFAAKIPSATYTFVDLFAGKGMFNDGTKGSPVIALEVLTNYLKSHLIKNFKQLKIIAIEKDENNQSELEQNIKNIMNSDSVANQIQFYTTNGDWQNYSKTIKSHLKTSNSGFIFADPFSTQLNMQNLKSLFKDVKYHDVLILINNNALERVLGLDDTKSLNIICKYFDVDEDFVLKLKKTNLSNAAVIRHLIKKSLEGIDKDIVINIALPRTRSGKIENGDRFYLCLLTSSVGVADSYLKTYAEIKDNKEIQNNNGQKSLFQGNVEYEYFNLCETTIKTLTKINKSISLYNLVSILYDDFFSWKDANSKEIPTSINLRTSLNILLENRELDVLPNDFIDKRCKS
ncbi:MAG: three-Cys-motif partner protein TcmP, partial [Candidatus Gastranaerophilales bacterium]|nr:three-Cys-motif partner protein TcmP [Candidatus Gastranaerophilales bacterium]